jgi:DNA-directed RNA polymerase subunit F
LPKNILSQTYISIPEVRKKLEERSVEELDQFQRRTLDYTIKFTKMDSKKAQKLKKELVDKFSIEEKTAVQIVNCMPSTIEELRPFFVSSRPRIVATTQLEEILKIILKYHP